MLDWLIKTKAKIVKPVRDYIPLNKLYLLVASRISASDVLATNWNFTLVVRRI